MSKIVQDVYEVLQNTFTKNLDLVVVDENNERRLPTDFPLIDKFVFGGGIPIGTFIMFVGHPGSFKSTFAGSLCAMAQKQGAIIIYLDAEASTTQSRLQNLGMKDVKPLTGITVEKVNGLLLNIAKLKKEKEELKEVPFIVVWDSVASTPCEADLSTDDITKTIGLKSRLLSNFMPKWINEILPKNNISIFCINQLREKVSLGITSPSIQLKNLSSDKTLPGGNVIQYLSTVIFEHKVRSVFDNQLSPYGFRCSQVEVKTVKNKYFVDALKFNFIFSPVAGLNTIYSEFEFLKSCKKVVSKGGYWYIGDMDVKFRLKELQRLVTVEEDFKMKWKDTVETTIEEVQKTLTSGGFVEGIIGDDSNGSVESEKEEVERGESFLE